MFNLIFSRLGFRCLLAVIIGVGTVLAFSALLSLYGGSPDHPVMEKSALAPAFPENEKMLQAMSDQLASESARLSTIAPAAGNVAPKTPKN